MFRVESREFRRGIRIKLVVKFFYVLPVMDAITPIPTSATASDLLRVTG